MMKACWGQVPIRLRAVVKQTSDVQRLDYPKRELYVHVDSSADVDRAGSCAKEPATVRWIEEDVDGVFYDIGANVGAYSLVAWAKAPGRTRVVAFEPGASTFSQLCRNILLNGCQDMVTPLNIALSDHSGLERFRYGSLRGGVAAHVGLGADEGASTQHYNLVVFTQPMWVHSLDEAIAKYELPEPNHIKIDVDGHELAILRGAKGTLAGNSVRSLQVEIGDRAEDGPAIRALLESFGFQVKTVAQHAGGPVADYVFVRGPRSSS
jgi:FkbM family methyltransferase